MMSDRLTHTKKMKTKKLTFWGIIGEVILWVIIGIAAIYFLKGVINQW